METNKEHVSEANYGEKLVQTIKGRGAGRDSLFFPPHPLPPIKKRKRKATKERKREKKEKKKKATKERKTDEKPGESFRPSWGEDSWRSSLLREGNPPPSRP